MNPFCPEKSVGITELEDADPHCAHRTKSAVAAHKRAVAILTFDSESLVLRRLLLEGPGVCLFTSPASGTQNTPKNQGIIHVLDKAMQPCTR